MVKKILAWMFPPPLPETSDCVEVILRRKRQDGRIVRLRLTGEQASRWCFWLKKTSVYCPDAQGL